MKFGYFDDNAKEYVITTPDTPLPWINYLGSQDFFSLISNTCGGYSFYKDAKLLRITRYRYNNIPVDSNGKYYYIHDGEEIWNPGSMPSDMRRVKIIKIQEQIRHRPFSGWHVRIKAGSFVLMCQLFM